MVIEACECFYKNRSTEALEAARYFAHSQVSSISKRQNAYLYTGKEREKIYINCGYIHSSVHKGRDYDPEIKREKSG